MAVRYDVTVMLLLIAEVADVAAVADDAIAVVVPKSFLVTR